MLNIVGSKEIIARVVYELNKDLTDIPLSSYSPLVSSKPKYFFGFIDEIAAGLKAASKVDIEKPYPIICNLLPEAGKFRVTATGIHFEKQAILLAIPVFREWTSEEISNKAHIPVLRPLVSKVIEQLEQLTLLEQDYTVYESSSLACSKLDSNGANEMLEEFGDYLAFTMIDNLNFSTKQVICEETVKLYQDIFKQVNL